MMAVLLYDDDDDYDIPIDYSSPAMMTAAALSVVRAVVVEDSATGPRAR